MATDPDPAVIRTTVETADGGSIEVAIPDEASFEAVRQALGDPVWLVGATWQVLTTNEFKRGRFDDALGAWAARQEAEAVRATLSGTGTSLT